MTSQSSTELHIRTSGTSAALITTEQHGPIRWLVRISNRAQGIERLLADPDGFLQDRALFLSDSPLITLAKVPPLVPGGSELVLRRLNYGRWRHRLRDVF